MSNLVDDILQKFNLKYQELTPVEIDTLNKMLEGVSKTPLTVESMKEYISTMRENVEKEVTQTKHNSNQDLFLKARLRNYILLEAFLGSPEKAKKALDRQVASLVSNIK